jgi:CheY-like chemotaxis protein
MSENDARVPILLVDDDEVDTRAVTRAFRKSAVVNTIVTARDGLEALDVLRGVDREKLPQPYLILLDLNMPRMNGIKLLESIRADAELQPSIAFVLTTSDRDEDKQAAYKHNVAGYFLKSAAGEGYIKIVELLERYVTCVQFPPPNAERAAG